YIEIYNHTQLTWNVAPENDVPENEGCRLSPQASCRFWMPNEFRISSQSETHRYLVPALRFGTQQSQFIARIGAYDRPIRFRIEESREIAIVDRSAAWSDKLVRQPNGFPLRPQ